MSWFSRKNDDEHVAQIRREFIGQMQILQQNIQGLQQQFTEEIQQLKNVEEVRGKSLAEEMYQLKQQRVSYWSTAQSTIDHMQRQVGELSKRISRFAPDPLPAGEKNLGELHALDIQKAQIANRAITEYGSTHQEIEKAFDIAQQKRNKEQENLHISVMNLFSSNERDTDKLQALDSEEDDEQEENPPETTPM